MEINQRQTSSEPYTKRQGFFKMMNFGLSSKTYVQIHQLSDLWGTLYETSRLFQTDEFQGISSKPYVNS